MLQGTGVKLNEITITSTYNQERIRMSKSM